MPVSFEDDATVLLKAALDLLKECDKGPFVKDALATTVHYDDAECDGHCLMEDIQTFLEEHGRMEGER